jgi:quercetin dioxygenase-like cupin family protein
VDNRGALNRTTSEPAKPVFAKRVLSSFMIEQETSSRRKEMAQTHARSGQVVSVLPFGDRLGSVRTTAVLKADQLEVVRIVLPAGKGLPEHSVPGEITVLCIEGRIEFRTPAALHVLEAGDLIHLRGNEPHALKATVDSSALLTLCIAKPA